MSDTLNIIITPFNMDLFYAKIQPLKHFCHARVIRITTTQYLLDFFLQKTETKSWESLSEL